MRQQLRNWDIGQISTIEPIASYWGKTSLVKTDDKRCFIFKEKLDLSHVKCENDLLWKLVKAGAPVAEPIRTLAGSSYALEEGKVFCLYPVLPGEVVVDHFGERAERRARAFGRSIAFLHTCFLKCDNLSGFREMSLINQIQEWAIPCIRENKAVVDTSMIERIWDGVQQEINPLYDELPKHLIHRDPNPTNMLFDGEILTGFIDFDMVVHGPRVFDICYCASSILVGGFKDPAKVEMWPGLFHALIRGYQEMCPLIVSERLALYDLMAIIQLLFMAFSLESHSEGRARFNAGVLKWLAENRTVFQY